MTNRYSTYIIIRSKFFIRRGIIINLANICKFTRLVFIRAFKWFTILSLIILLIKCEHHVLRLFYLVKLLQICFPSFNLLCTFAPCSTRAAKDILLNILRFACHWLPILRLSCGLWCWLASHLQRLILFTWSQVYLQSIWKKCSLTIGAFD